MGPLCAIPFLSLLEAGELPCCFLWGFLGTDAGEWCWGKVSASGALCTDADMLGAKSEQDGSEASLRVTFINRAFR